MKLIFSTAFDKEVIKNDQTQGKFIGPLGLLGILERELGLYRILKDKRDRITLYRDCLEKCKKGSFYEKAFDSSELAVATEILNYRDDLILMGWDYSLENQISRLNDLQKVEKLFVNQSGFEGVSDRWRSVTKNLDSNKINEFVNLSIVLKDPLEYLPNYLKTVFHKLECIVSQESELSRISSLTSNLDFIKNQLFESIFNLSRADKGSNELKNLSGDESFQILKFKNRQIQDDCIAAYSDVNKIVINKENSNFDNSLVSFGKPAAGSRQLSSNPQVVQIVKLIIPCFSHELNLNTLLSFLTLSHSPLEYHLSQSLARQLSRKPGVNNEEWKNIISSYTESEEENDEKELIRRKELVELFLGFNSSDRDRVKKAQKIFKFLKNWAKKKGQGKTILELKEQFSHIEFLCTSILDNFDFKTGSTKELENMINSFYEPQNFINYYKQEDSVDVIENISAIAEPQKKEVIWLNFKNDSSKTSTRFLLKEEIDYLKTVDAYDDPENQVILYLKQCLLGLLNAEKKLILCVLEDSSGEKHAFHLRLEAIFGKSLEVVTRKINSPGEFVEIFELDRKLLKSSGEIHLPNPRKYLELSLESQIQKRKVESASSIEKFIEYPFDWMMQYKARLNSNVGFQLPNDNLLKGNVAHKTIELLFTKYPNLDFEEHHVDKIFIKVLDEEAANFLSSERRFDLENFKYRFRRSLNTLLNIIKLNNFKIEGIEYEFGKEQSCIIDEALGEVAGFIDLILVDSDGNPFIIDLKWSFSDKKYIDKISKNEAIQLALYAAALKNRDLSKSGYFMLNQNKLITASKGIKGVDVIDIQFNNSIVLSKTKKSLEYRWSELQKGKIEIGDDCNLEDLDYQKEKGLISLPENKKKKKPNPYSGFKLFKGMIK